MMIFIRTIFLVILTTFLVACSQDAYRMQKYDSNMRLTNNKAVVVLGTKNLSFIDFDKFSNNPKTKIKPEAKITEKKSITATNTSNSAPVSADPNNVTYPNKKLSELFRRDVVPSESNTAVNNIDLEHQDTYRVLKATRFINYGYEKSIYVVEPGIYYISYAYSNDNDVENSTKLPGIASDGTVEYGAFEVKAGDVVYLGDIEVDWLRENSAKMFTIGGDLNKARTDLLAANYRELAEKLKQAKFLARGYKIH